MGGKGQKRREKNYRSAHGGHVRLPPPPDRSYVDVLPSKLRRLIAFSKTTTSSRLSSTPRGDGGESVKGRATGRRSDGEKSSRQKAELDDNSNEALSKENGSENDLPKSGVGKKKKRKRDQVKDLRYEKELEKLGVVSTRRQRKKEFLKSKKKKQKKVNVDDVEFHKQDEVKFGEVVQAPPKLVVPKAFKKSLNASHERLRLKAVEAYRDRKKWSSRPGVHLPFASTPSTPS
ncbi:hypothetical protein Drorol1_Dr00004945 [Drosera rotundifolia]